MEILPSEQLTVLCESSCKRDLESLRTSILRACTASYDVMVPAKVAYPGVFLTKKKKKASEKLGKLRSHETQSTILVHCNLPLKLSAERAQLQTPNTMLILFLTQPLLSLTAFSTRWTCHV